MPPGTDAAVEFIGGFVAAEGCFTTSGAGRFRFSVGLGATDSPMCGVIRAVLGVGYVNGSRRRAAHYDDEVQYSVQAARDLVEVVVPFMDAHLPASHKRAQYLAWRTRLLDHWEHHARRRATCMIEGCESPAKSYGLCRPHLWRYRRE